MRTRLCLWASLLLSILTVGSAQGDGAIFWSVDSMDEKPVLVPSAGRGDCNGPQIFSSDGTYETFYAAFADFAVPPYYGAFAECYDSVGELCAVVFDFTRTMGQNNPLFDVYVWEDDAGRPGAVAELVPRTDPGIVGLFPLVSRHEISVSTLVDGLYWVGYWGSWPDLEEPAWYVGGDLDGGTAGCPYFNVAPGLGYPTGWQDIGVVYGVRPNSLAIGVRVDEASPFGACCGLDGGCAIEVPEQCAGAFLGLGTNCNPNPCPQPPEGACCLPSLTCRIDTRAACDTQGGFYFGNGSLCEAVTCFEDCSPQLTAARDEGARVARSSSDILAAARAGGGGSSSNAGGVLFLHASPTIVYTTDAVDYCDVEPVSCEDAMARVDGSETVVFHAIAAFPPENEPRLTGAVFGISYTDCFVLQDYGACGTFELPSPVWPQTGEGTAVTWSETQTSSRTSVYWFAGYASYAGRTQFRLFRHPNQDPAFADDSIPARLDEIAGLGTLGFGVDGFVPCFQDGPGACCFADLTCELLFVDACESAGGVWQGSFTNCVESCDLGGACCLPDESCVYVTEDDCSSGGGEFLGAYIPCDPEDICVPRGACCFTDGSCSIATQDLCHEEGGDYLGDETDCVDSCPPGGACCLAEGDCVILTQEACGNEGGEFLGAFTPCAPEDLCRPTGACCFADGSCEVDDQIDCVENEGSYLGDDTGCDPNLCPQPQGACCLPDESCVVGSEEDCLSGAGAYLGDDTLCEPADRCVPLGGCCFDVARSCELLTEESCTEVEGFFLGDESDCCVFAGIESSLLLPVTWETDWLPGDSGTVRWYLAGSADLDVSEIDGTTVVLNGTVPAIQPVVVIPRLEGFSDEPVLVVRFPRYEATQSFPDLSQGLKIAILSAELQSEAPLEALGQVEIAPNALVSDAPDETALPTTVGLRPVFPNPSDGRGVSIGFGIPRSGSVRLEVHDVTGRVVRSLGGEYEAGYHEVRWDGLSRAGYAVPTGVYFARMTFRGEERSRRFTVVRR